jgi:hypothetical protein
LLKLSLLAFFMRPINAQCNEAQYKHYEHKDTHGP